MVVERTVAAGAGQAADYEYFCRMIQGKTGLDLLAYKRNQMERRILAMAERVGAQTLTDFWRVLSVDDQALRQFLDRVTINVSELFRNPEKFAELQQEIFPALLRERRNLSIWSAGCSYGAEAYSLRMVLDQLTPGVSHRIWATDIDRGVLERARQATFSEEDLRNVPALARKRYLFPVSGGHQVVASLRTGVEFARHDLLRDRFPERVDLILCRNVVIYFSDETKASLFVRFYNALRPGGVLLVGSTERIANAREIGFTSPRPFFYYRPMTSATR